MPPERSVIVVGAGLVGSIAALALAQLGFNVTVIERRAQPQSVVSSDARALVLSAGSAEILKTLGVWDALADETCPIRYIQVSERGGFGSLRLAAHEVGLNALGWSCPADRMLQIFNAAMLAHRSIKLMWSTRFAGLHEAPRAEHAGIVISYEQNQQLHPLSAALLIGADGARSAVRMAQNIATDERDYDQQAIVADVRVADPAAYTAFEHFTTAGPLAMIPRGDSNYVSVQCLENTRAEAALGIADGAYLDMLERRFGQRLGRLLEIGPRRAHALVRRRARTIGTGRTVLLGNAANTVHPNGAQGLNLGLRDVMTLRGLLSGVADPGDDAIIAAYCQARHRDHQRTSGFTDLVAQTFRSRLSGVETLRRAGLFVASHLPPLRRQLMFDASGLSELSRWPSDWYGEQRV